MGKGRLIFYIAVMAGLLGGFAWLVLRPHEPLYHGKPLSFWFEQAFEKSNYGVKGSNSEAEQALRALGTNALPILIQMAGARYSIPRMVMGELATAPNLGFLHLPQQRYKAEIAIWGFTLLGRDAAPAVPALIRLLEKEHGYARVDAAACLAQIGPAAAPAVPALLTALQSTNTTTPEYRAFRYWTMIALREMGPAAKAAIPMLEATNDAAARLTLMRIKGESLQTFIDGLKDTSKTVTWNETAWQVATLGTNAEPAIPLLLAVLEKPNPSPSPGSSMQHTAIGVLGRVHLQSNLCVSAILPYLKSTNLGMRQTSIYAIGNFGSAAKPALPDILRCLNDSDFWVRQSATNALRAVDPETAASILDEHNNTKAAAAAKGVRSK